MSAGYRTGSIGEGKTSGHGVARRATVVLITMWFMLAGALPLLVPVYADSMDGTGEMTNPVSRIEDLVVFPNEVVNITTTVSYNTVEVRDGGLLNVWKAGSVTAKEVEFRGGSIILAGTIKVMGAPVGGVCAFHGYGGYMKVESSGKLQVTGPSSGDTIGTSQGGRARIDFMADDFIEMKGVITASGNKGADATEPWKINGISGWTSAGGTVDIILRTRLGPGSYIFITGTINANGGTAGRAADAFGKNSGGYANGGVVGGNVGAGGDVNLSISSYSLEIKGAKITASGGTGGSAGNSGAGSGTDGGGGGGYAGGDGTTGATGNGVAVTDRVGSGGWVTMDLFATNEAIIHGKTRITGNGGVGGNAGVGGRGGSGWNGGGGGGGGYGGGGGASGVGGVPGEGTTVIDFVGAGGNVSYSFSAGDTFAISGEADLTLNGGRGGSQMDPNGGGGAAGSSNGGAGGGGGYGGGGGGGGWNSFGGSTMLAGRVGDGGDAFLHFEERTLSMGKFVEIFANGGQGGSGPAGGGTSGGNGATGGQGAGKTTHQGLVRYQIPMTAPYQKFPKEGDIVSSMPTFQWDLVHDTGPSPVRNVKGYMLQVATDETFDAASLVIDEEDLGAGKSSFKPASLEGGKYWWRVKTKFGDVEGERISSSKTSFYYNKPPSLDKGLPPIRIHEDENWTHYMNLDDYFTDDLYPETLQYGIVIEVGVFHNIDLGLDGSRNQWVNVNVTEDFFGQEYFNISATDEGGLTGYSGVLSVIVLPVNDPPVIQFLEDQLVTEDEETLIPLGELLFDEESWNPLPVTGQPTYQINHISTTTDSDFITVNKYPDMYPPAIDLVLLYNVDVESEHVNLTVSDGFASSTVSFIVNVTAVNDPPVTLDVPEIVLDEDTPKTIDLKKYAVDEEDAPGELTWKVRVQDRRLLDLELEGDNLLRLLPKSELAGQTKLYLTVYDSENSFDSAETMIKVQAVNDPPRLTVDHIWVPKGVEYNLSLLSILEDVDSDENDLEVLTVEMANGTDHVNLVGIGDVVFNYPDSALENDTMIITASDGSNATDQNLTIYLGYVPVLKNIGRLTFLEDERYNINLEKYVTDRDDNLSNLEWEVTDFDESLIDPEVNPVTGKLQVKAFRAGSGHFIITVRDGSGFEASQEVKVTVEPVTAMTYFNRNPGVLAGLVLAIVLVVLMVVLVVTSKRFGFPFRSMKKEEVQEDTGPQVMDDGSPLPPEGWVEGEGWTGPDQPGPDDEAPPEGGPGGPTEEPEGPEAPKEPGGPGEPEAPPKGPKLVPPPAGAGMKCVRCKEEVPPGAKQCPMCGTTIDKETRKRIRELRRKERRGDITEEELDELTTLEEGGAVEEGAPSEPKEEPEKAPESPKKVLKKVLKKVVKKEPESPEKAPEEGPDEAPTGTEGPKCPECGEGIDLDFIKCPSCNASLEHLKDAK